MGTNLNPAFLLVLFLNPIMINQLSTGSKQLNTNLQKKNSRVKPEVCTCCLCCQEPEYPVGNSSRHHCLIHTEALQKVHWKYEIYNAREVFFSLRLSYNLKKPFCFTQTKRLTAPPPPRMNKTWDAMPRQITDIAALSQWSQLHIKANSTSEFLPHTQPQTLINPISASHINPTFSFSLALRSSPIVCREFVSVE